MLNPTLPQAAPSPDPRAEALDDRINYHLRALDAQLERIAARQTVLRARRSYLTPGVASAGKIARRFLRAQDCPDCVGAFTCTVCPGEASMPCRCNVPPTCEAHR